MSTHKQMYRHPIITFCHANMHLHMHVKLNEEFYLSAEVNIKYFWHKLQIRPKSLCWKELK